MSEPSVALDPVRQQKARQYARHRRMLWVAELSMGALYLTLWIRLGWAGNVLQALRPALATHVPAFLPPRWAEVLTVALALALPWFVLTLPLALYSGFVLPRRYGLSTQALKGWIADLGKELLLSALFGIPLLLGVYEAMRLSPDAWWGIAAAALAILSVVFTVLSPLLIMPLFHKFKPLGGEHAELASRLASLAQAAGTSVRGVYTFDMSRRTRAANAALVGLGRTRRILLGDTLLSEFAPPEIESVMAHELAHHAHRDIPLGIAAQVVLLVVCFFLTAQGLAWAGGPLGLSGPGDPRGLPVLTILVGSLQLITMPLANAFSRWRESLADSYALRLTRQPQAFISALTRLANQNLAQVDPENWVVALLYSHPPLRDRIRKAQQAQESEP